MAIRDRNLNTQKLVNCVLSSFRFRIYARVRRDLTILTGFRAWFSWSVHRHLDGFAVRGDLEARRRTDHYRQRERFPATASADKTEIVEFRHLVLHHRGAIPQLRAIVLIVAGLQSYHGAVLNVVQSDHFKSDR